MVALLGTRDSIRTKAARPTLWLLIEEVRRWERQDNGGIANVVAALVDMDDAEGRKKRAAMVDYIVALLQDYEVRSPEKGSTADAVLPLLREIDGAQYVEDLVSQ